MAELKWNNDSVCIMFDSWWERLFTGRDRVNVPLAAVTGIDVTDRGIQACRGTRRGLEISGFVKVGHWNLGGRKCLVSLRRHRPTLRIRMRPDAVNHGFDELWVSSHSALAVLSEFEARPPAFASDDNVIPEDEFYRR